MLQPTQTPTDQIAPLAETFKVLKNSSNPEEFIKQLAMNKPEVKQIYNSLTTCNGDYKSVYMKLAKQQGMTEEEANKKLSQSKQLWDRM